MATENRLVTVTLLAAGDLSTKQFCHVKMSADRTVTTAGNGQEAAGILQDKPSAAGRAAEVAYGGVSKVLLGGTVTAGQYISADAAGAAVVPATGERITGLCTLGGAAGEIGEAIVQSYGVAP